MKIKNKIGYVVKLEVNIILQFNVDVLHITYSIEYGMPKKVAITIHNGFNYHYHFNVKELAEDIWGWFTCFGENTEKCITSPFQ